MLDNIDHMKAYWIMLGCNVITPQVFWFKWCRTTPWFLFIISIFVNIGMWFERFVIVVTTLAQDFMVSAWDYYSPTIVDWGCFIGSFGLFCTLYTLFVRFVPQVAMAEVKSVMKVADPHHPAWEHAESVAAPATDEGASVAPPAAPDGGETAPDVPPSEEGAE